MNGMQREIEGSVFIFPMILRIRTVRPERLTEIVNDAWADGSMLEEVTPTTKELLKWWFSEEQCSIRKRNFHEGQRQAILNIIYLHEVAKINTVTDTYDFVGEDLIARADLATLAKAKYQIPKYAVKMATGTGKTWVIHLARVLDTVLREELPVLVSH